MNEQKKEFTGVWIPKEVANDYTLNAYEKILYVEIASFPVCYMLNKILAERIGASEKTVSRYIKTLIDKGYVKLLKNDGRKRYIQAVRDFPVKSIVVKEADGILQSGQIVYSDRTICLDSMDDLSTKNEKKAETVAMVSHENESIISVDNSIDNKEVSSFASETHTPIQKTYFSAPDEDGFVKREPAKRKEVSPMAKQFMKILKKAQGISTLDGMKNNEAAETMVTKFKQQLISMGDKEITDAYMVKEFTAFITRVLEKDQFHAKNMTSMTYVKNNFNKLVKLLCS
jgi:DNA-binding transcriptional regulator GbsR (MarR family)